MELYEAIINDVLCYNLEQHVAFVVRIKAPAYQMFNENTDAEFKKLDLTGVKLDVRYNEGSRVLIWYAKTRIQRVLISSICWCIMI